ncbi:MAG: hypothetical protein Q8R57_10880 [Bacteroidota bacterium]|nr:hypothetical protein [Bacteroidota bacterium]
MLKRSSFCIIFTLLFSLQIFAQKTDVAVSKTELIENNTKVNVYYNISFLSETKTYVSSLHLSTDGGATFAKLSAVSGDIGAVNQTKTKNLKAVWDIFKDVDELSGSVVFKVVLEFTNIPLSVKELCFYQFSPTAPFGAMYVKYARFGYYGSLQTNFGFKSSNAVYANEGIQALPSGGYWQLGTTEKQSRFSITAGLVGRISKTFAFTLGGGFGHRALLWEYSSYNPDDSKRDNGFAKVDDVSATGLQTEFGLIWYAQPRIPISCSIQNINFSYYTYSIGVGIKLKSK